MTYLDWLIEFRDNYVAWMAEQDKEVTGFLCHVIEDFYREDPFAERLKSQIDLDIPPFRNTLYRYLEERGWTRLDYLNHLIELENAK